jgi:hypothetical protein
MMVAITPGTLAAPVLLLVFDEVFFAFLATTEISSG